MAEICNACGQFDNTDTCTEHIVRFEDGQEFKRSCFHFDDPDGKCLGCGIKHGGIHHLGCDVEECPRCGGQLITCYC